MSRESVLIILGVIVILSPFVGLPLSILSWILPIAGVCVAGIGFTLRSRRRRLARGESVAVESSSPTV